MILKRRLFTVTASSSFFFLTGLAFGVAGSGFLSLAFIAVSKLATPAYDCKFQAMKKPLAFGMARGFDEVWNAAYSVRLISLCS